MITRTTRVLNVSLLLEGAQLSDGLDDVKEIAEQERGVPAFQATSYAYLNTFPGGGFGNITAGLVVCEFLACFFESRHAMSKPGPAANHNIISIRIGVPRHLARVQKPRRVYRVPGCAHADAHKANIAAIALARFQPNATISVPTSDYITSRSLAECGGMNERLDFALFA